MQTDRNSTGADNIIYEIPEEIKESDDPAIDNANEIDIPEEMVTDKIQPFGDRVNDKTKAKK